MEKTILKKLNELEYHYTLLEEEVKMNYDTRNILELIHETRSLVEKLTIPNVVKSFFCNNERSKEGKCFEQCGVCSEYTSR
jgi:hypothetical protein